MKYAHKLVLKKKKKFFTFFPFLGGICNLWLLKIMQQLAEQHTKEAYCGQLL